MEILEVFPQLELVPLYNLNTHKHSATGINKVTSLYPPSLITHTQIQLSQ